MFFDFEKDEQRQQKARREPRFDCRWEDSTGDGGSTYIIVDRKTGVNYLAFKSGDGVGLTVLVDEFGKPVVTSAE